MNILFLTVADISDINTRGIYHDLLRKFRDKGHNVYIVSPLERKMKQPTRFYQQDGVHILKIKTLNIQKTNLIEKGIGMLLLERQFLKGIHKFMPQVHFDLVLYATPPITLIKVIRHIKKKYSATAYLLLKDIFPQNAVDLGMLKKTGLLHAMFRKKEQQLYQLSDYIGCMSPANMQYVIDHNPEVIVNRVEENPNSIEPLQHTLITDRSAVRQRYNIPEDAIVFLYGGNLGKPQGIGFLLDVLKANRKKENAFFLIVGDGTEYPLVEKWLTENPSVNILLQKGLPKHEYDQLAASADVGLIFLDKRFTIPNFPSRMLSYLENSMPVITATDTATDIGTIVAGYGAGYSVISGDTGTFTEYVDDLIAHPQKVKVMGQKAHQLLLERYTVDRSYAIIMEKMK